MNNLSSGKFAYRAELNISFEKAKEKVTSALKEEGFGVLTEIDMQTTLKKKLDIEFRQYVILGACNPPLAYQSLNIQLNVGLLLPCNVIVYEEGGGSVIEILNPIIMMDVADNPDLVPVAQDAQERLLRVINKLQE